MNFQGSKELLRKYLAGNTTIEETRKVEEWYSSIERGLPAESSDVAELEMVKDRIYRQILNELKLELLVVPIFKRASFKVGIAAIFCFLIAGYWVLTNRASGRKFVSVATDRQLPNDIAPPVIARATLTLADGSKIALDSSGNGILAIQGKINIEKRNDGQIAYTGSSNESAIRYNTLTVPRGSKPMKLLLGDGSEVWLNVASSIRYPTSFESGERRVEIEGEAYFEVAKNEDKPFVVMKKNDDVEIRVLGTHFDVNAYDDEPALKVTLLEGSVNVSKQGYQQLLKPGEQAMVTSGGISRIENADIEQVMAWKNGRFYFDGADIKTVMKQVEKWYNVEVSYEAEIPYSFVAKISRDVNASQLFNLLQLTELVHFRIEGNKIAVMK